MLKSGYVSIKVFDILGKEIENLVNEYKQAGVYSVSFESSKLGSGVFFYKMQTNDFVQTKKMIINK